MCGSSQLICETGSDGNTSPGHREGPLLTHWTKAAGCRAGMIIRTSLRAVIAGTALMLVFSACATEPVPEAGSSTITDAPAPNASSALPATASVSTVPSTPPTTAPVSTVPSASPTTAPTATVLSARPTHTPTPTALSAQPTHTPTPTVHSTKATDASSATYLNAELGYSIELDPGWEVTTADSSLRVAVISRPNSTALLGISVVGLPTSDSLENFALRTRRFEEELAIEQARYSFAIESSSLQNREGRAVYLIASRSQATSDSCVVWRITLLSIPSFHPGSPYGYILNSSICEDDLNREQDTESLSKMMYSFKEYVPKDTSILRPQMTSVPDVPPSIPSTVRDTSTIRYRTKYTNDNYGYSIRLPAGWSFNEKDMDDSVHFFSNQQGGLLMVKALGVKASDSLLHFAERYRRQAEERAVERFSPLFKVITFKEETEEDLKFYLLEYRWKITMESDVQRRLEAFVMPSRHTQRAYGFTIRTYISEDNGHLDTQVQETLAIMRSFRWHEPSAPAGGQTETIVKTSTPTALGVTTNSIQSAFEELGFVFQSSPLHDGTPRVIGKQIDDATLVEVVGPPNRPTQATTMFTLSEDEVPYVVVFMQLVVPTWTEGINWVAEKLAAAIDAKQTTTRGNLSIRLSAIAEMGIFTLTVEAK